MVELRAERLSKRYGRRILFRELACVATAGERLAVTGDNGSGKSTLLKILCGLVRPTTGAVSMIDHDGPVSEEDRPLRVGFMAPYLNFYATLTARENLLFAARARGMDDPGRRVRLSLEAAALQDAGERAVSAFSSGMLQRLRMAAALLAAPRVLLLDEPYANLDEAGCTLLDNTIARFSSEGGITIMATNQADRALRFDRALRVTDFAPETAGSA